MSNLQWCGGVTLGVLATACITVSNKHLLMHSRAWQIVSPTMLLLMHRITAYVLTRWSYACEGKAVTRPHVPLALIISSTTASNMSIFTGLLLLREASITFQQLSRLIILPMSALVDYFVFSKSRTALDYASILLISYGVVIGLRGEVSATMRAVGLAILSACFTVASTALVGRLIKTLGIAARDCIFLTLEYEIVAAGAMAAVFPLVFESKANAAAEVPEATDDGWLLLALGVNLLLAAAVIYLTTWTQGATSNMLYAVLGQVKMLATIVLDAVVLHTDLSVRTKTGLVIALSVAVGLAVGDPAKQQDAGKDDEQSKRAARRKRLVGALCFACALSLIVWDASFHGKADIVSAAPFRTKDTAVSPAATAASKPINHAAPLRKSNTHQSVNRAGETAAKTSPGAVIKTHKRHAMPKTNNASATNPSPKHV